MIRFPIIFSVTVAILYLAQTPPSVAADTKRDIAEPLAECAGRLTTAAPYSQSYDESQSALSLNARVLSLAQKAFGLDDLAAGRLAEEASKRLTHDLLVDSMNSRSIAADVRQQCNDLAKKARLVLGGGVDRAAVRSVKTSTTDRPTKDGVANKDTVASNRPVIAPVPSEIAGTSLQGQLPTQQAHTGVNSAPEQPAMAKTTMKPSGSVLAEFKNWKQEEEKQREEEAKAKKRREEAVARAEAERLEKLKPIMQKQAEESKLRDAISKERSEVSSRRKDDKLYQNYSYVADVTSPDYRDSCEFMPDVAVRILEIYGNKTGDFRSSALGEIEKAKRYIKHDVIYDFMANYVINTLDGNDEIKRKKLIDVINGKSFSTTCFLYGVAPNLVQKTNDNVADATKDMDESFEPVSIDESEPYYGLLCARLAADNQRLVLNRVSLDAWFANKARDLKKTEPIVAELFSFYRNKILNKDPSVIRSLLSNEWNRQCVEVATKI